RREDVKISTFRWQAGCSTCVNVRSVICDATAIFVLAGGIFSLCAQTPLQPASSTQNQAKNHDPLNRDTPQSTVVSFLEACHAKDYSRAWRYLDLRALPDDRRLEQGPELARQLQEVLDRDARFDVGSLSHDPEGDLTDGLPGDRELID